MFKVACNFLGLHGGLQIDFECRRIDFFLLATYFFICIFSNVLIYMSIFHGHCSHQQSMVDAEEYGGKQLSRLIFFALLPGLL